jgi:hypothetical protein
MIYIIYSLDSRPSTDFTEMSNTAAITTQNGSCRQTSNLLPEVFHNWECPLCHIRDVRCDCTLYVLTHPGYGSFPNEFPRVTNKLPNGCIPSDTPNIWTLPYNGSFREDKLYVEAIHPFFLMEGLLTGQEYDGAESFSFNIDRIEWYAAAVELVKDGKPSSFNRYRETHPPGNPCISGLYGEWVIEQDHTVPHDDRE